MVLGKLDSTCKNIKSDHFSTPYTKESSKWIKDLNMRSDTIKFLEENNQNTLRYKLQPFFFDSSLRINEIKTKINKWDLFKLKVLVV